MKLFALLGNYDRPTDRRADGFIGKFNIQEGKKGLQMWIHAVGGTIKTDQSGYQWT